MADSIWIFKRPMIGIIAGLLVFGLLAALVLANRLHFAGWFAGPGSTRGTEPEILALQAEVYGMIDRLAGDGRGIEAARREVESNMNRLEGLLRSPRSPSEKAELGAKLMAEEQRWEELLEQAKIFDRWGTRGQAMVNIRAQLAGSSQAMDESRHAEALESLSQARSAIQPLLNLGGTVRKMQQARQAYAEGKQELDILVNTYRIAELPGSGELAALDRAAAKALGRGELEQSVETYQSAARRVAEMKRAVLSSAIERAKRSAAAAIKAGDPAQARNALDRVKELSRARKQLGPMER